MFVHNYIFQLLSEDDIKFKNLTQNIKKDNIDNNYGCYLPKKLKINEFIICFVDISTNTISSFIWFGIQSVNKIKNTLTNILINSNVNSETNYESDIDACKYIHVNFSYTFKTHRNIGLNKMLRLWIENYCLKNNIGSVISVPLAGSNSENILIKLGYDKKNLYYIKKIF